MSKKDILARIRQRKPAPYALPDIPAFPQKSDNVLQVFMQKMDAIGGRAFVLEQPEALQDRLAELFPEARVIVGAGKWEKAGTNPLSSYSQPTELQDIDVAIVEGSLGVAENGAVWVTETQMGMRVLPFIAEHLVLILRQEDLVPTMHDAYARIQVDAEGFGAFIAGPSKTADIEQALVIGAQGPRSCTIFLGMW